MSVRPIIRIGESAYAANPEVDRYQIPLDELRGLRMMDIPPHSHVEVMDMPAPEFAVGTEVFGVNGGEPGVYDNLSVYGGFGLVSEADDRGRMVARLRRAFPPIETGGVLPMPRISLEPLPEGQFMADLFISLDFGERPDTLLSEAVAPFLEGFRLLKRPGAHVFICHASEDKATARDLASGMERIGAAVWLDESEIRVGDSIVEKISTALDSVTHLLVLLSRHSVARPWVKKELSVALMRQLSEQSIAVLPVRLDDCAIPPILADIKYADCRNGVDYAVDELERALFPEDHADVVA